MLELEEGPERLELEGPEHWDQALRGGEIPNVRINDAVASLECDLLEGVEVEEKERGFVLASRSDLICRKPNPTGYQDCDSFNKITGDTGKKEGLTGNRRVRSELGKNSSELWIRDVIVLRSRILREIPRAKLERSPGGRKIEKLRQTEFYLAKRSIPTRFAPHWMAKQEIECGNRISVQE